MDGNNHFQANTEDISADNLISTKFDYHRYMLAIFTRIKCTGIKEVHMGASFRNTLFQCSATYHYMYTAIEPELITQSKGTLM